MSQLGHDAPSAAKVAETFEGRSRTALRTRIMGFIGGLVLVSLLGSTFSLYRITEVNRSLDAINQVSVPLGRLFSQMQSDADVLSRELERGLGVSHWKDPHWKPRPVPKWIEDVLDSEIKRMRELIASPVAWAPPESRARWTEWADNVATSFARLRADAHELHQALEAEDGAPLPADAAASIALAKPSASKIYPRWVAAMEDWRRELTWGSAEYERALRQSFTAAEGRVTELRIGLELILVVVVAMSLLMLWLGERALRPLAELTRLAREITRRGLRREDKQLLPEFTRLRDDEVSQLAREFHRMATALLERERMVEAQKSRLEEQNRQLREMGELKDRLREAEHLAAIGRMSAQVAHEVRNPLHSIGLEAEMASEMAAKLALAQPGAVPLKQSLVSILFSVDRLEKITDNYLKLSRLSTGERQVADLGEILETTLATYAPVCESQGVHIDWSRETGSSLEVCVDRDLIEQVLGNLLRNSLQALAEGGARGGASDKSDAPMIRFSMGSWETGRVWLRIEDNGPGIAPEIRARLFTPFVTSKAQGTGLGLPFIKRVLEEHDGEIRCLERSGAGACFEIALPPATERFIAVETSANPEIMNER